MLLPPGACRGPPPPTSASHAPPEDVRPGCGRSFLGPFPKKAGRTLACWFLMIKVLFSWSDPATPNRLGLFCPRGINRQDASLPPYYHHAEHLLGARQGARILTEDRSWEHGLWSRVPGLDSQLHCGKNLTLCISVPHLSKRFTAALASSFIFLRCPQIC